MKALASQHVCIPGPYVHVYQPQPDVFPGPDSESFRAGERYSDWVPNDHCVVKGPDGRWHAFGITHPAPPAGAAIHEGEWLSFHAAAPPGPLAANLQEGTWEDLPKVLPPGDRPGEKLQNHAPFVVERDSVYHMVYGPSPIRLATSTDLFVWTLQGPLFEQDGGARDPCVLVRNGGYVMVYCSQESILARTSDDLVHWSDEPVEIFRMRRSGAPESPALLEREGRSYLFWCIWDDTQGPYDHRTFVYMSDDPLDFLDAPQVGLLDAHAPEIIVDELGDTYITSAEWPRRGLSIAPLVWG